MTSVITLISSSGLEKSLIHHLQAKIAAQLPCSDPIWLHEKNACDLMAETDPLTLRYLVAEFLKPEPIDAIVQLARHRRKKLLLADMDSTIVTSETLDELANFAGVGEYVAAITERAMNGELDFIAALKERVALLKGLSADIMKDVWYKTRLSPGAATLVQTMKKNGGYCTLISGGFRYFTERVANKCGFNLHIGNQLETEDGLLTGKVMEPIVDKDTKLATLKKLARELNIRMTDTLTVGDGANDVPMLKAAGLGVAYRGRPNVQDMIPDQLNHSDLTGLLYAQGYHHKDFIEEEKK